MADIVDVSPLVVSDRVKRVLEQCLGELDNLQFFEASFNDTDDESHSAWILHFPEPFDPLDTELTHYTGELGGIRVAGRMVLDRNKIHGRHVFTEQHLRPSIIISDSCRRAIQDLGPLRFVEIETIPSNEESEPPPDA